MAKTHSILALDVGDKRVGVAVANSIAKLPNPLAILENGPRVYSEIASLAREHDAFTIVVGLPRDMHGRETGQSEISRGFADNLKEYIDAQIIFADESLSSKRAEETRSQLKRNPDEYLDDVAACFILEEYLKEI